MAIQVNNTNTASVTLSPGTAAGALVLGGQGNAASGLNSGILGSDLGSASGTSSAIVGASNGSALGTNSAVIANSSGYVSGSYSIAAGGLSSNITSSSSGAFACNTSSTIAGNSVVLGGSYGGNRFIQGHVAIPASAAPIGFNIGASQAGFLVLGAETYNATPRLLTSTNFGGTGFDFNQLSLQSSTPTAYYFKGTVVAYINTGAAKSWTFDGLMRTNSPDGFVGTPTIASNFADAGTSTWTVTLSFDSGNRALAVTAVGSSTNTVRWVCKLETTEVSY